MVAGVDAPSFGEGKNSWLTGTAAWTFTAMSQYILGIQPTLDGLRVNPCIPSDVDSYKIDRAYRGQKYHITIENPSHVEKGVSQMTVDGQPVAGNVIPLDLPLGDHDIMVTMG